MPWRDRYQGGGRGFFSNPVHGSRLDSVPAGGGPKGSDPDFLREQLIDEYGVAYAILISRDILQPPPDPDYAAAIAAAFNDWLVDTWLRGVQPRRRLQGLDHGRPAGSGCGGARDRALGRPPALRPGDDGLRRARALRAAPVLPDLRGLRAPRPAAGDPSGHRRHGHQPSSRPPAIPTHYIEWHCMPVARLPGPPREPAHRGRLRALPRSRHRPGRGRRRLAAGADVAAGRLLEGAALGGAVGQASRRRSTCATTCAWPPSRSSAPTTTPTCCRCWR